MKAKDVHGAVAQQVLALMYLGHVKVAANMFPSTEAAVRALDVAREQLEDPTRVMARVASGYQYWVGHGRPKRCHRVRASTTHARSHCLCITQGCRPWSCTCS